MKISREAEQHHSFVRWDILFLLDSRLRGNDRLIDSLHTLCTFHCTTPQMLNSCSGLIATSG
jgi:hypothetical protein